ncbi:GH25 family lysozyme [Rugosimonospora africana]|uniref:lysozyme n=1 Tax=Rugosimonospora africana TaxID=556532 RepID=A0A8J3QVX3_9ACTN|nr:GH25 family lysozyme [Rugosimonospora africana]GIH16778.1 hypothetical protein Raf01_49500 [Rugosimonospora africana]
MTRRSRGLAGVTAGIAAVGSLLLGGVSASAATPSSTGQRDFAVAQQSSASSQGNKAAQQEDADHAGSGLSARVPAPAVKPFSTGTLKGLDVSGYQENVDWPSVATNGATFAYIKATESTDYVSSYFGQQFDGSAAVGLIRGAYHFAHPDASSGATQADYFVDHGGGWTADGKTLPGALDIEYNPSGSTCYGLSPASMVSWIASFVDEYRARTTRYPTIYSTVDWWASCTGNSTTFGAHDPLWVATYSGASTPLPTGWNTYTVWQNDDSGTFPGDQDLFNGTLDALKSFALGDYSPPPPPPGTGWPIVRQGQKGRQVTTLQYLLDANGASLTVDGKFGPGTRRAAASFQSAHGLTAHGIVGANTWQWLIVTVRQGSTGLAVKALQAELNARGASLTVNGQFDADTGAAVLSFQADQGLEADGIVGRNTWRALVS